MVRYQDLGSAGLLPTSMERDRQAEGERQRDRGTWDQTGLLPSLWRETDGQSGGGGSKRKREGGRGKEGILGWRGQANTQEIPLKCDFKTYFSI